MEITKHEILFSIVIILAMLGLGLFISNGITKSAIEQNEILQKALKVDENPEAYDYSLKTNVPNILAYGTATANQPVGLPEIIGEYSYIYKHKERYTQHTRTVTTTDSEGHTHTHVEIYYTWDAAGSSGYSTDTVIYLGKIYSIETLKPKSSQLSLNSTTLKSEYLDCVGWDGYLYESSWDTWGHSVGDLRWYFTYVPKQYKGSLHIQDTTQLRFYYEETIEEVVENSEVSISKGRITFWIIWILLTCGTVAGFYYIDNRWLE